MGPPTMSAELRNEIKNESRNLRPRRGSLPDLKNSNSSASSLEKKPPTGPKANPLYKTRLCMNYQSTGSCPYTEKCQFAHGVAELEKWEVWRSSSHVTDSKNDDSDSVSNSMMSPNLYPVDVASRSRSHSEENQKSRSHSVDMMDSHLDSKTLSLNWEIQTPVKPTENRSYSESSENPTSSSFSYWSSLVDEMEKPVKTPDRARSSTHDSTYDNMSQLKDAPTLFSFPPVLPNLSKLKISL